MMRPEPLRRSPSRASASSTANRFHWPEGTTTLLSASALDPDSMEPDYNAAVTLHVDGVTP
jgi:hypothetical protein